MSRPSPAVVVLLGLAACGGDAVEPLLGVWQVASHTHNDVDCAAEGPALSEPPFVQFLISTIEGQEVIEQVDCTSPTTCAASGGLAGRLYTEELPAGRRAQYFTAFGDSARCALAAFRSDAVVAADGMLRIESRTYESRDVAGVPCEGRTAQMMFASLSCRELDVMTAQVAP